MQFIHVAYKPYYNEREIRKEIEMTEINLYKTFVIQKLKKQISEREKLIRQGEVKIKEAREKERRLGKYDSSRKSV